MTAVKVKATSTSSEVITGYSYDANGNLETVTDPLGGVTTMVYDSVDRLTEKHLPNGVLSTYEYDDRDRVLSVAHYGVSGLLASTTYVRSASGEPTKITREDGSYVVLTYDAALRLDTETYYNAGGSLLDAIDYDYDFDGNRTRKTSLTGGVEDYSYSAGFRLDSVTHGGAGTDTFGYDGGGRVTSIARDGGTQTLTYNSDDKLTRVAGGTSDVQYTYDGVGRRVAKVEGGATTRYLVAPNLGDGFETPQAVTDASGNVLASYVFAGEHPLMRIEGGVATYYLQDAMGSVVGMAGASGTSTGSIKYDGFGNVTSSSGMGAGIDPNIGSEPRFQGMSLDQATGLYFVRARTYDPRVGRFTSRDPVDALPMLAETYHPYTLAFGNPQLWRDPTGMFTLTEVMVVSVVIGVLAAMNTESGAAFFRNFRLAKFLQGAESFPRGIGYAARHGLRLHGYYGECEAQRAALARDITHTAFRWIARLAAENPQQALELVKEIVKRNPEAILGRVVAQFGTTAALAVLGTGPAAPIITGFASGLSFYGTATHFAYLGVVEAPALLEATFGDDKADFAGPLIDPCYNADAP